MCVTLTSHPFSCNVVACPLWLAWFWSNRTECVERRREVTGERTSRRWGSAWRRRGGAVCHCESAQGVSHHLSIDGCPSPVVKQAPTGPPEHWGHCVPPSQETYHPKCCNPPLLSPPSASLILYFLPRASSPSFYFLSGVNFRLEIENCKKQQSNMQE